MPLCDGSLEIFPPPAAMTIVQHSTLSDLV
jgi:hypothetical protein